MTLWDALPDLPKAVEAWNRGGWVEIRVEDVDGTFLNEFGTNAEDIARQRVNWVLRYHPQATVTFTPEDPE